MASVKLLTRHSTVPGKPGILYIQIIHNRKVKWISTGCPENTGELSLNKARQQLETYSTAVAELDKIGAPYTFTDILDRVATPREAIGIVEYVGRHIDTLMQMGRYGSVSVYKLLVRNLRGYLGDSQWLLERTDREKVWGLYLDLSKRGISRNTLSSYMRPLRVILQKAEAEGLLTFDKRWFADMYLGVDKTVKRATSAGDLQKLKALDLSDKKYLCLARDVFLFSFYACGMAFVDIAHLTRRNIVGNEIVYKRQKTDRPIRIPLIEQARSIIDNYAADDREYLFPLLTDNERKTYDSALRIYNQRLDKLGKMAGCTAHISSYISRHTWATRARDLNIPLAHISSCMGHESQVSTSIYLASIASAELAETNRRVCDLGNLPGTGT